MSLAPLDRRGLSDEYPLVTELTLVVAVLVALRLWTELVAWALRTVLDAEVPFLSSALDSGGLVATGLFSGTLFVLALALFVGTYVVVRDVDVPLSLFGRAEAAHVALAVLVPLVLVALTDLVGGLTGNHFSSVVQRYSAAGIPLELVATMAGLGLLVSVPTALLLNHVLLQGTVRLLVHEDVAIVLTTVTAGFLFGDWSVAAGLPKTGPLVAAGLFVLALAFSLVAYDRLERPRARVLPFVPLAVLVALTGLDWIASIDSVAAGLFALTQLTVVGLAAYTYERTDSLLVPALAYVSLSLSSEAVVVFLEAGVR